jgi:stress response protein SCP2
MDLLQLVKAFPGYYKKIYWSMRPEEEKKMKREIKELLLVKGYITTSSTPSAEGVKVEETLIGKLLESFASVGYILDADSIETISALNEQDLAEFYSSTFELLKQSKGDHVQHVIFYKNFPEDVYNLDEGQWCFNAIIHYITCGEFKLSDYQDEQHRLPFDEKTKPRILSVITMEKIDEVLAQISVDFLRSRTSISDANKERVLELINTYGAKALPDEVPMKENLAFICSYFITHKDTTILDRDTKLSYMTKWFENAQVNDALRLAASLSDGDETLTENTRFKNFNRSTRRTLLTLIESVASKKNITEDMKRYQGQWTRLGERLHPGEYSKRYPKTFKAFRNLRNEDLYGKIRTFNSNLEKALDERDTETVLKMLKSRPGEFARKLDFLVRESGFDTQAVLEAFGEVGKDVASPVLIQLFEHFEDRLEEKEKRVFILKGKSSKVKVIDNNLEALAPELVLNIQETVKTALRNAYAEREEMGKVYISEEMKNYALPTDERTASDGVRIPAKGSKFKLEGKNVRFFTYWHTPGNRTDIDTAALFYNKDGKYIGEVSWHSYNRDYSTIITHSGDIVDGSHGASEFVDVKLDEAFAEGIHYIALTNNVFSGPQFKDFHEVFGGFMPREELTKGKTFDPKTVENIFRMTSASGSAVSYLVNLETREVVWLDVNMHVNHSTRVATSQSDTIFNHIRSYIDRNRLNVFDIFVLNAEARGEIVDNREDADLVIAEDGDITPFDLEKIATFM